MSSMNCIYVNIDSMKSAKNSTRLIYSKEIYAENEQTDIFGKRKRVYRNYSSRKCPYFTAKSDDKLFTIKY